MMEGAVLFLEGWIEVEGGKTFLTHGLSEEEDMRGCSITFLFLFFFVYGISHVNDCR